MFGWRRCRHGSCSQTGRSTRTGQRREAGKGEREEETVEFCVSNAEQRAVFLVVCVFGLKISSSAGVSSEMDRIWSCLTQLS